MHRQETLNDVGVDNLVQGIVLRAVEDWRHAKKILKLREIQEARARMEECEKFFKSSWFEMLTGFKGDDFMVSLKNYERERLCG